MLRKLKQSAMASRVTLKKSSRQNGSNKPARISRDTADLADAVRLMADPKEVPIDYEQARKKLGLD